MSKLAEILLMLLLVVIQKLAFANIMWLRDNLWHVGLASCSYRTSELEVILHAITSGNGGFMVVFDSLSRRIQELLHSDAFLPGRWLAVLEA